MNKNTLSHELRRLSGLIFITLAVITIPIAVLATGQQQETRQHAAEPTENALAPLTTLFLYPQTLAVNKGTQFIAEIRLDSGQNSISGIDTIITYDPNILTVQSLTDSKALGNKLIAKVDKKAGTIRYVAVDTTNKTPKGVITIGSILFEGKNPGTTSIGFLNSQVTVLGFNGNALKNTVGANFVVLKNTK